MRGVALSPQSLRLSAQSRRRSVEDKSRRLPVRPRRGRLGLPEALRGAGSAATGRRRKPRIGVFGGTFDPVHRGHIGILRAAQKHFGFDRVYVVPAYRNPLKRKTVASMTKRLTALRAAIRPLRFARLSLVEVRQNKPCYMIDTLRYFKRRHPGAELVLISGSDILDTFRRWKDPAGILRSATVAVAHRPGFRRPSARRGFAVFPMKPVDESSTRLRSASPGRVYR